VKGSRYITHMLRLRNVEGPLANFFAQGLLRLGAKLGPILWQFPPNFSFEAEKFEEFLAILPATHREAAELARKHDSRMRDRSWFQVTKDAPLRHAVEIRNESFANETFIRLLRRYRVASVVADTVEWPLLMDVSSDFVYCRLHGSEELYASGYDAEAIETWARRVAIWAGGGEVDDGRKASSRNAPSRKRRDVYVYFDNDIKVKAPYDAEKLRARVEEIR
jgi:uncharacterized protein YecE (DUF72 family)